MRLYRCSSERCSRANSRASAQENFRNADTDATPQKEINNLVGSEEEVADSNPISDFIAEEETFASTEGRGITDSDTDFFSEKETNPGDGRRIAIAHCVAEKEKGSIANSDRNAFAASKEKAFADAPAVRVT